MKDVKTGAKADDHKIKQERSEKFVNYVLELLEKYGGEVITTVQNNNLDIEKTA